MAEITLGSGVLVPALMAWVLVAFALTMGVRRALAWAGFYRFVWHRPLFDLALGIILLGGTVAVATHLVGPNLVSP